MNLITLEEYKMYQNLGPNPADDIKDSFLINSVSALIQTYIGKNISTGGKFYTEIISLDYETNMIFLKHYPVQDVSIISESARYTWDSTVHVPLVYESDFTIDNEEGIIFRSYRVGGFASWPISPGTVTISYTTGASEDDWDGIDSVPFDLKLACINLVNYYKDEEYRQSKSAGGSSITNTLAQGTDFPQHIQVILDRYKDDE